MEDAQISDATNSLRESGLSELYYSLFLKGHDQDWFLFLPNDLSDLNALRMIENQGLLTILEGDVRLDQSSGRFRANETICSLTSLGREVGTRLRVAHKYD